MIVTRYDMKRAGMEELRVQSFLSRVTQKFNIKHHAAFAETADRTRKLLTTHFNINTLIDTQREYTEKVNGIHKRTNQKLLKELIAIREVIKQTRNDI